VKGFDTASDTTGWAHRIADLGFLAVGAYMRPDRCSQAMVRGLHSVGVQIFSIWEKGEPVSAAYFDFPKGVTDALAACDFAASMGQPAGTPIFACVDYDAAYADVQRYLQGFHETCRSAGYLAGTYGSGLVCSSAIADGISHYGFLSQSTGFPGYEEFRPAAAIVQGASTTVLEFDVDLDEVQMPEVCW
jgi:hypothetical protein